MHHADGYAAFILPAYGITALVFIALIVDSLWRSWQWRRKAEARKPE